jgi:hypothetical protein
MNTLRRLGFAASILAAWLSLGSGQTVSGEHGAIPGGCRQYYSGWHSHAQSHYYYRTYYFKPAADYHGYKHHYVIYSSRHPNYLYFYNPYKKLFWGRCPAHAAGQAAYSPLAEQDRKGNFDQIPESAFPPAGPMPPIPESKPDDGTRMDMPPDDLPSLDSLPR